MIEDQPAEALKKRDQLLREVIDSARCVLWEARVREVSEGNYDWKLNILSPDNIRKEFGFQRSESGTDNDSYVQRIPPEEMARMDQIFHRALKQNEPGYHQEFCIYAADGGLRHMSETVRITPDASGAFHLVGVQVDITERKRAEEALRLSQEQLLHARTTEAVGQFATGAAQYFGNLMNVVKGYSNLMLQSLGHKEAQQKNIEMIQKVVARAEELTQQLTFFGQSGSVEPEILDLNQVVSETYKLLRPVLREDVEFHTMLGAELGKVKASRNQIEQALIAMAINARQAMPSGGKLIFETLNVELSESAAHSQGNLKAGSYVLLAISDTGIGMDEQVRARLFKPFFTTKGLARGTGLNLAAVHAYVLSTGGDIEVASEPGQGTRFKIYLPRAQ